MTTRHDRRGCTQPSQHALRAVMGCLAVAAHLALPCAVTAGEQQGEWLVYTSTGMERRAYTAPTTVEVGLPEEVEVPSEVTGTGQGTRVEGVEGTVSEAVGGPPNPGSRP